jgi:hypothetical protein
VIGYSSPPVPPGVVWLLSDILLSGNVHSGLSTVRASVRGCLYRCILYLLLPEPSVSCLWRLSDI